MAGIKSGNLEKFFLPRPLWEQIQIHLDSNLPEEACGLVGGVKLPGLPEWRAHTVYPVENILHSPSRYRMDGRRQLAAFEQMDQADEDLIAIFHSHPNGPGFPSPADISEAYYPEAIQIVCFRIGSDWRCRGYQLFTSNPLEIDLIIPKE